VKKVVVTAEEPIPVQIDGDPGGYVLPRHSADATAGWTVEVVPAALDVIARVDHGARRSRLPLASDRLAR
jgi:diacylglycerol kinase family enzyme